MYSDSESEGGAESSTNDPAPVPGAGTPTSQSGNRKPPIPAGGRRAARPTSGFSYTFSSLGNRDYLYLWLGMVCQMGGMMMQGIAQGYLVYAITRRPFLLGVVNAGSAIPILTLSLFGGAIADRVDRKRIIQLCQLVAMLVALLIAISIATGAVTWVHLFVASMVQGGLWSFMLPARQAIIPEIVGRENLANGLALNAAGMSAMTLLAPAAAGTLYAIIKPEGVYFTTVGLLLIAVVLSSLVSYEAGGRAKTRVAILDDIKEGLFYMSRRPMVLLLLIIGLATTMLAMPFRSLIPVFVVDIYGRGPEAMGLLVSVMGLGSLAGAMAIVSLGKWKRGLLLILGAFMSGAGLVMVAAFPSYLVAVGMMVLLGLGDATRRSLNQTLIMEVVEDRYRGRVMSVYMMNFGLMPLGVLPAGYAIEKLGGELTIAIMGAGVLAVATVVLVTQRRLREFQ